MPPLSLNNKNRLSNFHFLIIIKVIPTGSFQGLFLYIGCLLKRNKPLQSRRWSWGLHCNEEFYKVCVVFEAFKLNKPFLSRLLFGIFFGLSQHRSHFIGVGNKFGL